jgi:hypothetical protein
MFAAVGLVVTAGAVALRLHYAGTPAAEARSRGMDALWLGHAWVDGRRSDDDRRQLVERVARGGVRDLYVHVGPLADDGRLDPGLAPAALGFLRWVRRALPGVREQAWLGNVVGRDRLDLADSATRRRVVDSAAQVLAAGFDGMHYDLEPVPDDDPDFLDLLDATRAMVGARDAVLSVAAEAPQPLPGMAGVAGLVRPQWWSPGYLHQVAIRVDQVALMTYDTAMPTEPLYGGLVARQVGLALNAVPRQTHLLVGAPAFHTSDAFHHPSAETVAAAVRAARLGLSRLSPAERDRPFGIALYVDFAATDADWNAYYTGWVRPAD